jgi:hypothetical protein
MQCERLIKLIKSWYIHVQGETMAPARMVSFMKKHAESCEICLQDADLSEEIAKITEIVLPESKIPKAIRQKNEQTAQAEEVIENEQDNTDDSEENSDTDESADENVDEQEDKDNENEDEESDEDLNLDDDPELLAPP